MALTGADLVRVAELIKLGAETALTFSDTTADGECSRITDAAKRVEAASEELATIGREMESRVARAKLV